MKKVLIILTILLLAWQLQARTIRVLAIGNSFSEDAIEQNLYELCLEHGDTLIIGNAYRGGQGLESQWKVISTRMPDYEYRKVERGVRTNLKGKTIEAIVADEPWDVITFQQVSQDAGVAESYEPFLSQLLAYVKTIATNPHVRYGFQQTWAYAEHANHAGFVKYGHSQARMFKQIVAATKQLLTQHHDIELLIPSGTAIQNARTSSLGDHLNRDGYHLDLGIGRYIAACTWAEIITGHSMVGSMFRPSGVTEEAVTIAQRAAHAACKQPFKVKRIR